MSDYKDIWYRSTDDLTPRTCPGRARAGARHQGIPDCDPGAVSHEAGSLFPRHRFPNGGRMRLHERQKFQVLLLLYCGDGRNGVGIAVA